MVYPKHLSEKIREEVAVSYLKHEFRKIFPSIDTNEVANLMKNSELSAPRDFWNGLHGISMGFKLKNVLYFITAENIIWTKEKHNLDDFNFGVELQQTKLVKEGKLTAAEVRDFYNKNRDLKKSQLDFTLGIRGNDNIREEDPIITIEKMEKDIKVLSVYDGNGRLGRHILEDDLTIEAFVGRYSSEDKRPMNFWLPTSLLMENLNFVYLAIERKDEVLFNQQIAVMKNMLSYSESGKYEFRERALSSKKEYRDKILTAMGID
jgi:hypothetical protein